MSPATPRIDSHVHFFSAADLARAAAALPYACPDPHPLAAYLDRLIDSAAAPRLLNNVHLSVLPDSANVFASFAELERLQQRNPGRYGAVRLVGTIWADPDYATAQRLAHPQVQGVRIVVHDAGPDAIADYACTDARWRALFARLRADQHVHIYAQQAATACKLLRQLPTGVRVLIDHLGTCDARRGVDEPGFCALLAEARRRGNVYFKGPGYRTASDPALVLPFAVRIVESLGAQRLLLQASDAPHVGADAQGRAYGAQFTAVTAFDFAAQLARATAAQTGVAADALLYGAAAEIFPAPFC